MSDLPLLFSNWTYSEEREEHGGPLVGFGEPMYSDGPVFHMPHQCDEWIIGDAEDVKALIADLQAALALQSEA